MTATPTTYRVLGLRAENIKRIDLIEIKPQGDVVEITGANEQGKSSLLDSLWMAIGGEGVIPSQPIRKGQTKGRVEVNLGNLKITRTFNAKEDGGYTTAVKVESADGMVAKSPQALLNGFVGQFTFDPLAFIDKKPEEQFNALKTFVPGVDFDKIRLAQKNDFESRTEKNREAKRLRTLAEQIIVPVDTPEFPVDDKAIMKELETIGEFNVKVAQDARLAADMLARVDKLKDDAQSAITKAADLRAEADRIEAKAKEFVAQADTLTAEIKALPEIPAMKDGAALRANLEQAQAVNRNVAKRADKAETIRRAETIEAAAAALTEQIDQRKADVAKAVSEAAMPVEGLSFGDGIVLFNGVPLDQASRAQQIRVSCAIAAALNPKLKIAFVKEGSLLDNKSWELLSQVAKETGCQIWVETVESSRPTAIVIEDGRVKGSE